MAPTAGGRGHVLWAVLGEGFGNYRGSSMQLIFESFLPHSQGYPRNGAGRVSGTFQAQVEGLAGNQAAVFL